MRRRVLLLALTLTFLLGACGGNDDEEEEQAAPATTAASAATGEGGCRAVEPQPKAEGAEQAPTAILNEAKTYVVTVKTSCGDFEITLDLAAAPKATASFVALAENDFYDGTVFHRVVPGFVIQGGDPTASGTGGPGYTTVDTPAADTRYTKGVVAMAKRGDEAPGTAGSQFFVVTGDDAGLPADYAVIGTVTGGATVVDRIAVLGDPNTELPTQPVVIDDMVVEVS
jgi:peptidyl-prolyl cis-trans isomerase B (cyclophilin B)